MKHAELVDQFRHVIREHGYSVRTERPYIRWLRQFLDYFEDRAPSEISNHDVTRFLNHLENQRHASASTQNQALSALQLFYREVLGKPLKDVEHSKRSPVLPVIFTRDEVRNVLQQLKATNRLMAGLLYGSGLRIGECLFLRVRDLDFGKKQIIVRNETGHKDRVTFFPESLIESMTMHLEKVKAIHEKDLRERFGQVPLPFAAEQKNPEAGRRWEWQFVFPSHKRTMDQRRGTISRQPVSENAIQRAVRDAIRAAGIRKQASCHTFRHSFAVHLLENGCDVRTVQELIGHKDMSSTMVYTQLVQQGKKIAQSPLDML